MAKYICKSKWHLYQMSLEDAGRYLNVEDDDLLLETTNRMYKNLTTKFTSKWINIVKYYTNSRIWMCIDFKLNIGAIACHEFYVV